MKHYGSTFGVLFLLLLSVNVMAQRAEMLCTQTANNGDITLTWRGTAIPVSGYQYKIYGSRTIIGTYDLLDSVPTTITSYTHATDGAQQWFFFVKAVPVPPTVGATYRSDTLGSIYFIFYNPHTGVAHLQWKRPSTPPLPSQDSEYVIWRGESGILQKWTQTDTIYYADTVHVCNKKIDYQIVLSDNRGCDNISIVRSDNISDFIDPNTPQLDSVSINLSTKKTELGWNPSSSPDVFGYILYIRTYSWQPIDTIYGANNTHYIDFKNDASNTTQQYRVASIDTCLNASPMGEIHNTMICNAIVYDVCDSIVSLSWNAYQNMPSNLTGYRILASENSGTFYLVDTVEPTKLSYAHKIANPSNSYSYYIQAYNLNNGYTASSTQTEKVTFTRTENTGKAWLRYVSVINNKDVEIAVFASDTGRYKNLWLFRSDNDGTIFFKIDEKGKTNGTENYLFTDSKVDVQTTTYLYTICLTDECDDPFFYCDTANNIVLTVVESLSDMNEIAWLPYDGFDNRLDGYDVYRQLQTETDFQLITNWSASQTDYEEDVYSVAASGGRFYYKVSANEDYTNPYGFQDQSFSNVVELTKSPHSYIPNAFSPSSNIAVNRIFKPVLTYVDAKEYMFAIFDRWGNQVFYTTKITEGWDGTINGKPAAMGVYQYCFMYRLNETQMYKKQGHVTLLR